MHRSGDHMDSAIQGVGGKQLENTKEGATWYSKTTRRSDSTNRLSRPIHATVPRQNPQTKRDDAIPACEQTCGGALRFSRPYPIAP